MLPAWLCSICIGEKLKWNNESHVLLPSSSSVLQSSESSVEILAWGWHTRQRWVTPVICWLKCFLSIIRPNTELLCGVGLCSFCSRVFLLWSFWHCWCSSFWGHDIITITIINCFFLTAQKCLAWRYFTDWVWKLRQSSVLFRDAFAADYDCIPEATGTARITFQSLVRTSLAIDFEDCNSGVQTTASQFTGCWLFA